MPSLHSFRYTPVPPDRLTIEISGVLGDYIAEELTSGAVEALAGQPGTKLVLLDLRKLEDFTVMARVGLQTLQKLLRRRDLRTAWLVTGARFYGLATLVAHGAADPGAGIFQTLPQAETWLFGNRPS